MVFCSNIWNKACGLLCLRDDGQQEPNKDMTDEYALQQAHQELQQAQNWFANLDEPEMVEYAIYKIKAAEKHYDYLLKRIRTMRANKSGP